MAQVLTETQLALKLAVEAETDGNQTIIFTEKGQASFMYKLAKFDMSKIDPSWSGVHPAFIVDGVEKDYIYIGVYSGVFKNGEIVSQPNQKPMTPLSAVDQQSYVTACGAGFHVMSYDEWAAVALLCRKNEWFPFGITSWGGYSSFGGETEKGRYIDPDFGANNLPPYIYTGSGTVNFRHDLKYTGISDLVGNNHERIVGMRLVNSELHFIDPNYCKNPVNDLSKNSSLWKAMDATTGALVERTFTGTIVDSTYTPTTSNSLRFGMTANATTIGVYVSNAAQAIEVLDYSKINALCVSKLQQLGILSTIKYADTGHYGKYWNDVNIRCNAETQYIPGIFSCLNMLRGGGVVGGNVGIDSYNLDYPDDLTDPNVTCRPCYYE
ncbi:MAG: hypothetical protein LKF82_07055 [Acinetobacter populi]|jgi:hypothetical protein|uniref:hypothetical protein n=1 Tax=Acinetobacter populi TaxID=1582270 RepID=UPI002357BAFE|nr:hypothetical protein [Acinetobacter populi]MCH4247583.1 hypothetical protein [Acinetobacter populi]